MYFKERVYATFTGLAIVLVVLGGGHADAVHALSALILGVLGITAAGFVSDVISHLAAHQEFPSRREVALMLKVAGGALGTLVVPVVLLALAAFEVMPLDTALRASSAVYVATLGLVGWIAVRRSRIDVVEAGARARDPDGARPGRGGSADPRPQRLTRAG